MIDCGVGDCGRLELLYEQLSQRESPIHFGFFVWGARLSPQLRHPTALPKTPTSTFPEAPDLPRGICRRLRCWRLHRARWRRRRASGAVGRARGVTGSVPQRGSAPRRLFQILGQNTGRDFSTLKYYNLAENHPKKPKSIFLSAYP